MGILDYFKPVSTWSPEEVRRFLKEKNPEEYNLVDVRTPKEYEGGHLPGARLIPVGGVVNRLFRRPARFSKTAIRPRLFPRFTESERAIACLTKGECHLN